MTRWKTSASSRSPTSVDPARSQKTTVAVLRVSLATRSGRPQPGQKFASSPVPRPQYGHSRARVLTAALTSSCSLPRDQRDGSAAAAAVRATPGDAALVVTAPRLADRTVSAYLPKTPQAMGDGVVARAAQIGRAHV